MKDIVLWVGHSLFLMSVLLLAGCTISLSVPNAATTVPVVLQATIAEDTETVAVALATIEAALTSPASSILEVPNGTPNLVATLEKLAAEQTAVAATLTALAPTALLTQTPDPATATNQIATAIAATLTANVPPPPTPNLAATQTAVAQQIATAVMATIMAQPTPTSVSKPPTHTPIPLPTNTPMTPPLTFHPISLSQIANASTQEGYVAPPLGLVELNGILFDLPSGQNSVTTQAEPLPTYPTELVLSKLDIRLPQAVYLLITGGNTRVQFEGDKVGTIDLIFSNNQHFTEELVPGRNLREWKIYGDHNVTWTSAATISEAWRTPNHHDSGLGIIDLLTITVPAQLRNETLLEIRIYDQSQETVGSMDPAINLLGVTVLGQE